MTSLWLDGHLSHAESAAARDAEIVVVGAGLTGMVTAVLLARAGKRVVVVEGRTPGACATGNTTAKVSLLQGTRHSSIAKRQSPELVRQYVEGNREGQSWLTRYCAEHGVDLQFEDAITYAGSERGLPSARAEFEVCRSAGLDVEWVDTLDVPFDVCGAVRLAGQAQFNPMEFVDALIAEFVQRDGRLVTGRRVQTASVVDDCVRLRVRGSGGNEETIEARQCVLATGTPILDRGAFFARLEPSRSYCVAFTVPGEPPRPMMLSADSPTRSLRYAVRPGGGRQLIVGGGGHVVGRKDDPRGSYAELIGWTERHFPGARPTHRWSAQDYVPVDGLPYVGPLLPGSDRIFVATGFAKWGMTNGVAAALLLSKRILGGQLGWWAPAFDSWSGHELRGTATALRLGIEVGRQLAAGWAQQPWHKSPVCPHLGGVLSWNDAEKSWDCPLHGSRFAGDGTVLEGPATRDAFIPAGRQPQSLDQ